MAKVQGTVGVLVAIKRLVQHLLAQLLVVVADDVGANRVLHLRPDPLEVLLGPGRE